MSSTRVSNRLRAKRFKAGTATAEDKAYVDKKYNSLVCADWLDAENSVKPLSRAENKALEERVRCEPVILTAINHTENKKPTLIIEEDNEEQEKLNDQMALQSLIEERKNKINSLYRLNQEIERLEKKWAEPRVIHEMTPEKFRNALSDLGYIKK
jgi:hypothetical protein